MGVQEQKQLADRAAMRTFSTGATRDTDEGKHDYEGYLSPLVLERFAEYMTRHRVQPDGSVRDSDNWQKGIPLTAYMKSGWRHFMDWWRLHRGGAVRMDPKRGTPVDLEESLCALLFNVQGYLHEHLKAKGARIPVPVGGRIVELPTPAEVLRRVEHAEQIGS